MIFIVSLVNECMRKEEYAMVVTIIKAVMAALTGLVNALLPLFK